MIKTLLENFNPENSSLIWLAACAYVVLAFAIAYYQTFRQYYSRRGLCLIATKAQAVDGPQRVTAQAAVVTTDGASPVQWPCNEEC